MLKICVDKSVNISIHYCLDIAVFVSCSRILCKSVGHKYVGADLRAPFDICLVALNILNPLKIFADFDFKKLLFKHLKSRFLVLKLASFSLTSDHDARGLVKDADSGVRFIDMLTARSA